MNCLDLPIKPIYSSLNDHKNQKFKMSRLVCKWSDLQVFKPRMFIRSIVTAYLAMRVESWACLALLSRLFQFHGKNGSTKSPLKWLVIGWWMAFFKRSEQTHGDFSQNIRKLLFVEYVLLLKPYHWDDWTPNFDFFRWLDPQVDYETNSRARYEVPTIIWVF